MEEEHKQYHEEEEPYVHTDRETGEPYIINPAGTIIYIEGEEL
jgi:hypothetical protein